MDFHKHAGREFVALDCQCCDIDIREQDPVYVDHDERGTRVLHSWCYDYSRAQYHKGQADAYAEVLKLMKYNSALDFMIGLEVRTLPAPKASGADVLAALFHGIPRQ